jgi:hypothetical protein
MRKNGLIKGLATRPRTDVEGMKQAIEDLIGDCIWQLSGQIKVNSYVGQISARWD